MSLRVGTAVVGPFASPNGDSDMAPGKAARAAIPPSDMCQDFMAYACAFLIPVTVPFGALVGAIARTSQKLPFEQVVELNRATANVVSQLSLDASFRSALEAEAQRRGITLSAANSGTAVLVEPQPLTWDVNVGNQVALRVEVDITVERGGEEDSSDVTRRSELEKVAFWIADNGQPIRQSLEELLVGASREVWDRVLGEE